MSADTLTHGESKLQEYLSIWTQSITRVLEEVAGAPVAMQELAAEKTLQQFDELAPQGLWIRFELSQALSGEHGFLLSKDDGLRLSQTMRGEPQDPTKEFTEEHREALGELFGQFAGSAAVALKGLVGGEVKVQFGGLERPKAVPAERVGFELASSKFSPFAIFGEISSDLVSAASPETAPSTQAPPAAIVLPRTPASSSTRDPKLDLLMDVELDVTLRFGERQMLLRDVLELNAGSVVELDQQVQDPVELLVGGKVIARGEVVVVDGNYGLRVNEIVSPMERIASLRR